MTNRHGRVNRLVRADVGRENRKLVGDYVRVLFYELDKFGRVRFSFRAALSVVVHGGSVGKLSFEEEKEVVTDIFQDVDSSERKNGCQRDGVEKSNQSDRADEVLYVGRYNERHWGPLIGICVFLNVVRRYFVRAIDLWELKNARLSVTCKRSENRKIE